MRATRAYLAGFGTSGSLLAGAALMFVLASAFVAFQGWPQVAGQSAPVLVSVPRVSAPTGTRISRALSATTATPHRAPAGGAAAGLRPTTHVNPTHASRGSDQTTVPVSRDPGTRTGHNTGPTPRTCTSGCGQAGRGPIPTPRRTIQGTAHGAGSTVNKVVSTVTKVLPVSKGSGSGGGIVGGVVKTTTTVVKSITGGLP